MGEANGAGLSLRLGESRELASNSVRPLKRMASLASLDWEATAPAFIIGRKQEMGVSTSEIPRGRLPLLGLMIARMSTSAWIGAATLFVIVGVTEVTRAGFDSATKDTLVAVRFPAYYAFGWTLVSCGWIGSWIAGDSAWLPKSRRRSSLILLAFALLLMTVDYFWIYQPLLGMVTPPGQAKPAVFALYHEASKWINLAGLIACVMDSALLNCPISRSAENS